MPTPAAANEKASRVGLGCLLLFGLFWTAGILLFDGMFGAAAARQILAKSYPTTPGMVTRSEVEVHRGKGKTYSAKIEYRYEVAGQKYSGNRYRYGSFASSDHSAERVVADFPVGKKVAVHYAAGDPSDAVLIVGIEGLDLFVAMFMTPFNLIMLGICYLPLRAASRRRNPPPAGGARIWDDGFRIQVRLNPFSALAAAISFFGLATFAGVFVIGFTQGFNPPLNFMLAVWTFLFGGSALVYLLRTMKLASGATDLVIDLSAGNVVLPRIFGRTEEVVVPLKAIQQVEVERVAQRAGKGKVRFEYFPTLVYLDRDRATIRARLARWQDSRAVEDLAAWLREKLNLPAAGRQ